MPNRIEKQDFSAIKYLYTLWFCQDQANHSLFSNLINKKSSSGISNTLKTAILKAKTVSNPIFALL